MSYVFEHMANVFEQDKYMHIFQILFKVFDIHVTENYSAESGQCTHVTVGWHFYYLFMESVLLAPW